MNAPSVIFVCGRNAVRSPMAEAFWKMQFGDATCVQSCGVAPASWPDGFMIAVMAEQGLDLSEFECRALMDTTDESVELVICLSTDVDEPARAYAEIQGAEYQLWPIDDPVLTEGDRDVRLAAYRHARDAIFAKIQGWPVS